MEPDRLIVEDSLELVARRLRMLGFDVASAGALALPELLAEAERQGRIALTPSARHPRRYGHVRVISVPLAHPAAAVRRVVRTCMPAGPPFTRCPRCNVALEAKSGAEAVGHVPQDVLARVDPSGRCPACGRWFWEGSHTQRVRQWLRAARVLGTVEPGR